LKRGLETDRREEMEKGNKKKDSPTRDSQA